MERNELFEKYLYLADELVEKYGSRYAIDKDDAIQEARMCLFNVLEWKRSPEYTFEEFFRRFGYHEYLRRIFEAYCPISFSVEMAQRVRKGLNMIDFEWSDQAKKSYRTKKRISDADLQDILSAAAMVQNYINYEEISDDCDIIGGESVENQYISSQISMEILDIMCKYCTEREVDIIASKLGLLGKKPEDFSYISKRYGVSPQRIGELYKKGMEKLCSPDVRFSFKRIICG